MTHSAQLTPLLCLCCLYPRPSWYTSTTMLCDKTTALCSFQLPIPLSLYVLQVLFGIQQFISSHKRPFLSASTCHLLFPGWHLINWQNDLLVNVIYNTHWDKQDGGYWDLIVCVCVCFFHLIKMQLISYPVCPCLAMTWISRWTVAFFCQFSYAASGSGQSKYIAGVK